MHRWGVTQYLVRTEDCNEGSEDRKNEAKFSKVITEEGNLIIKVRIKCGDRRDECDDLHLKSTDLMMGCVWLDPICDRLNLFKCF